MRECHVVNRHDTNKVVLNSVIKLGGLFCLSSFYVLCSISGLFCLSPFCVLCSISELFCLSSSCVLCSISELFCLSSFYALCSIGMLHKMTLHYEIYELRKRITNIHIQKIKVKVSICFSNQKFSTF